MIWGLIVTLGDPAQGFKIRDLHEWEGSCMRHLKY